MDTLPESIAGKKERLDGLRPLAPEALARLEHYYDIELTYTSNAIDGNTLSPVETTLVIEQGVTIGASRSRITWRRWIIMTPSATYAKSHARRCR